MTTRTYYQILGVSRDATPEEISNARTALAKVYHPDANIQSGIDTTGQMQEILEAYRVLSNPEKRKKYDLELSGGAQRVFKTFSFKEEAINAKNSKEEQSFVTYWNAASSLQEIVRRSNWLLERESRRKSIAIKVLERIGHQEYTGKELKAQLEGLSMQALNYIKILKDAKIPMEYWQPECMNWLLIHWGQNPEIDYHTLLAQYDAEQNQNTSSAQRIKIRSQNRQFHQSLKKLLTYAL